MTSSDPHKTFLRRRFEFRCSRKGFTLDEIAAVERYGSWLFALEMQRISPVTDEQRHFVGVFRQGLKPLTAFEKLWKKYRDEYCASRAGWVTSATGKGNAPLEEWRELLDFEAEEKLIAKELAEDAEDFARVDEEGWYYAEPRRR